MALNKGEILTFEIGDKNCHFLAPRMIFRGPTGTYRDETLFTAKIEICFGGHSLAFYNINVPCFEIGDEICHFLGTKSAMFGPQNGFLRTFGDETLFIARIGPNLVWWTHFGK